MRIVVLLYEREKFLEVYKMTRKIVYKVTRQYNIRQYTASYSGHETVVKLLLAAGSGVNKATDVSYISW